MRPSVLALVLWTAISLLFGPIVTRGQSATGTAAPGTPDLSRRSDKELVKELLNKETRDRAFYELERRRRPDRKESFEEFQKFESNRVQDVIVCDQGAGAPPLYLVLQYGFDSFSIAPSSRDYPPANGEKLFAPAYPTIRKRGGGFALFTGEGNRIECNNNYLLQGGVLADINADGFVERVETMRYRDFDGQCFGEVLTVSRVAGKEDACLLTLMIELDREPDGHEWVMFPNAARAREWTFDVTDRDKDGIYEIEIGPMSADGVISKEVFQWDKAKRTYASAKGSRGDHFAVIPGKDIRGELKRLRAEGFGPRATVSTLGKRTSQENPFARKELAQFPKEFWDLPPKQAARAFAEANRSAAHRQLFRLAVDDLEGQEPPSTCSLKSWAHSSVCPCAGDFVAAYRFLRCDRAQCYYAFAGTRYPSTYSPQNPKLAPVRRVVFRELPYEDARRIVEVIWWLNRVRSYNAHGYENSMMASSTNNGFGEVRITPDRGADYIEMEGTLGCDCISQRWFSHYAKETFLNLTDALLANEVPRWLGRNSSVSLEDAQDLFAEDGVSSSTEFRQSAKRILPLFSLDERAISIDIVQTAVEGIGNLVLADLKPDLQALLKKLPPRAGQSFWDLNAKEDAWDKKRRNASLLLRLIGWMSTQTDSAKSPVESLTEAARKEHERIQEIEFLRDAINEGLKRLEGKISQTVAGAVPG